MGNAAGVVLFAEFLFLVVDEHNEKTDGQQPAGQPDRPRAPMEGGYAADTRAQREQQHHAEIRQRLVEYFLIPRMEVWAIYIRKTSKRIR